MKQKDAQAVAKYIAQALGKTGINIKLCISRLEHYTHGIRPTDLDKFIRTAFRYNQESPAKAESYLSDILLQHGVEICSSGGVNKYPAPKPAMKQPQLFRAGTSRSLLNDSPDNFAFGSFPPPVSGRRIRRFKKGEIPLSKRRTVNGKHAST